MADDIEYTTTEGEHAVTVYKNGKRLIYKSKDIWDKNTKLFLDEYIKQMQVQFENILKALANSAPVKSAINIHERDHMTGLTDCQLVWVVDATGDPTVEKGAALYLSHVDEENNTTFDKLTEVESLDLILNWDNIENKPNSLVSEIDDAVLKKHTHENAEVLNALGMKDNQLTYNGKAISGETGIAYGSSLEDATTYDGKLQLVFEKIER